MDRSVLEADPHAVLEGMVIGAKAVGAEKGFIYIRHEYPLALHRIEVAINDRGRGLLGENILGSGFNFDVEVVEGAGAFVSGEETASSPPVKAGSPCPGKGPPTPPRKGCGGARR